MNANIIGYDVAKDARGWYKTIDRPAGETVSKNTTKNMTLEAYFPLPEGCKDATRIRIAQEVSNLVISLNRLRDERRQDDPTGQGHLNWLEVQRMVDAAEGAIAAITEGVPMCLPRQRRGKLAVRQPSRNDKTRGVRPRPSGRLKQAVGRR